MNIEHLSKSQIVLLTLLVSFVTSIATGIVTVSLMEQAPPSTIAQSVNRIVERTVEKVVPGGQTAAVVTREKTVIVKESDLISQVVVRVSPSVVRLYTRDSTSAFLGLGVVIDSSGVLVSDSSIIGDSADAEISLADGTRVRAVVTSRDAGSGIAFLQSATTTAEGKVVVWQSAAVGLQKPVLGQTVITFSGRNIPRISDGIVTALVPPFADASRQDVIDTNISGDSIMDGSILVNTDGEVVGMSTGVSREISSGGFVSASALIKNARGLDNKPAQ
jgi:S1-C subfamily serine protease